MVWWSDVWYYLAAVGIWQEKQHQGNFLCSEKFVVFFRSIWEYYTNDSNPCLWAILTTVEKMHLVSFIPHGCKGQSYLFCISSQEIRLQVVPWITASLSVEVAPLCTGPTSTCKALEDMNLCVWWGGTPQLDPRDQECLTLVQVSILTVDLRNSQSTYNSISQTVGVGDTFPISHFYWLHTSPHHWL